MYCTLLVFLFFMLLLDTVQFVLLFTVPFITVLVYMVSFFDLLLILLQYSALYFFFFLQYISCRNLYGFYKHNSYKIQLCTTDELWFNHITFFSNSVLSICTLLKYRTLSSRLVSGSSPILSFTYAWQSSQCWLDSSTPSTWPAGQWGQALLLYFFPILTLLSSMPTLNLNSNLAFSKDAMVIRVCLFDTHTSKTLFHHNHGCICHVWGHCQKIRICHWKI